MKYEIEKWFRIVGYCPDEEELKKTLSYFSDERAEVRRQMAKLDWYCTPEEQEYAVSYLTENLREWEYIYLVLTEEWNLSPYNPDEEYYEVVSGGKWRWENAAKVIVRLGWPKVDRIIIPLFYWLLDGCWPGSLAIESFLQNLPEGVFEEKANHALNHIEEYFPYGPDTKDLKKILSYQLQIRAQRSKNTKGIVL